MSRSIDRHRLRNKYNDGLDALSGVDADAISTGGGIVAEATKGLANYFSAQQKADDEKKRADAEKASHADMDAAKKAVEDKQRELDLATSAALTAKMDSDNSPKDPKLKAAAEGTAATVRHLQAQLAGLQNTYNSARRRLGLPSDQPGQSAGDAQRPMGGGGSPSWVWWLLGGVAAVGVVGGAVMLRGRGRSRGGAQ